jgi:hypothetical protein
METTAAENLVTELFQVSPRIGLLNKYVQRVKKVAINSIDPIYADDNVLAGFHVRMEGPARQMRYLTRLLSDGELKVG